MRKELPFCVPFAHRKCPDASYLAMIHCRPTTPVYGTVYEPKTTGAEPKLIPAPKTFPDGSVATAQPSMEEPVLPLPHTQPCAQDGTQKNEVIIRQSSNAVFLIDAG